MRLLCREDPMQNPEDAEQLFLTMKQQFLEDPEGNLEALRECSARMATESQKALQKTLLLLHNMKGSAQAVGFSFFAYVLHDAEEVLGEIMGQGRVQEESERL